MKKIIIIFAVLMFYFNGVSFAEIPTSGVKTSEQTITTPVKIDNFNYAAYMKVNPLDIVARPGFYLNKNINVTGKFDKFSTLGLDYEPAMRSSDKYISFLIQRPDVLDHNLPLSEMKCFLTREDAEKFIELNSGDKVEFWGTVFSNALGDVWVDVKKFKANEKNASNK